MNPFYTMPNILTETSEGATAHSLQDELFKEREIELVGEITQESAYSIILQLRYARIFSMARRRLESSWKVGRNSGFLV